MSAGDPTEPIRRILAEGLNKHPRERGELEAQHGKVWDTNELLQEFTLVGFIAPYVAVIRNSDGMRGSLLFQHSPRFYWDFMEKDS